MSTRWSLDSPELRALRPCYAPARKGNSSPQGEFKAYGRAGALRPLSVERLLERGCIILPGTVRSRVKAGGGKGRAGTLLPVLFQLGMSEAVRPTSCHLLPSDSKVTVRLKPFAGFVQPAIL